MAVNLCLSPSSSSFLMPDAKPGMSARPEKSYGILGGNLKQFAFGCLYMYMCMLCSSFLDVFRLLMLDLVPIQFSGLKSEDGLSCAVF